jgi:predicted XRE-type DNA-binding protein
MNIQRERKIDELTLSELRVTNGDIKQSVVALLMNVQEPAVSKMERKQVGSLQVDKLKKYLSAIGVDLEMTLTLQNGDKLKL